MHSEIKPYQCDTCSKEFGNESNLLRHVNHVHKKSKPNECELCKKLFSDKGNLKVHLRLVHNNSTTVV